MAQTGYTPIQLYYSSTTTNVPLAASLANGELAINITDGKLFYKDNAAAVQVIGWKTTPTSAGGTGLTSYTAGDTLYYASGTTLTKLAIGTAYQAFQVNAGATAPSWQPSSTSTLTAQGDLLYASGANTLARLAKNTSATRYLSNTGTTNNPAWAQIDLTNGVTGTLPVGNGGTGLTTLTAGYIPYGNATSAFSSSANLYYGGKNMGLGTSSPVDFGSGYTTLSVNDTTGGAVAFLQAGTQKGGIFNAGNNMYIDCSNSAGNLNIRNTASGGTTLIGPSGVYSTTVGATNRDVYVDDTGLLGYVTSTEKSKKNIVDLDNVDWLLNLQPKTFNRRKKEILFSELGEQYFGENYLDETYDEIEYGLIAEITETQNSDLCFYDIKTDPQTNKKTKVLAGINYSKLIVPLLKKIQQQEKRINELEGKL